MRGVEVFDAGDLRMVVTGPTAIVLSHAHICFASEVRDTALGLTPRHARRRALRRLRRASWAKA